MTNQYHRSQLRDPLPGEVLPTIDDRDELCLDGWSPLAMRVRNRALKDAGLTLAIFRRAGCSNRLARDERSPGWRLDVWMRMRAMEVPGYGYLSWPEIGLVTGTNHSTIVTAMSRLKNPRVRSH